MSRDAKWYWDSFVQSSVEFWRGIPEDDWNDYEKLQKDYWWNPFAKKRMEELAYEENQRWLKDRSKNMGFDLGDNLYPIRSGYYNGYTGYGDYFEASESVINLFLPDLLRWR